MNGGNISSPDIPGSWSFPDLLVSSLVHYYSKISEDLQMFLVNIRDIVLEINNFATLHIV